MPRMLCAARSSVAFGALALLAACASHVPGPSATQEAARYAQRARNNYVPPGSPEDPWGPYIHQAAARFDVPELWIRAVMHVESNGQRVSQRPAHDVRRRRDGADAGDAGDL